VRAMTFLPFCCAINVGHDHHRAFTEQPLLAAGVEKASSTDLVIGFVRS
jgi:hypothetical protein